MEMTESKIPISTCRPQGATLRKVRFLKHTEIRPLDGIFYVITRRQAPLGDARHNIKGGICYVITKHFWREII